MNKYLAGAVILLCGILIGGGGSYYALRSSGRLNQDDARQQPITIPTKDQSTDKNTSDTSKVTSPDGKISISPATLKIGEYNKVTVTFTNVTSHTITFTSTNQCDGSYAITLFDKDGVSAIPNVDPKAPYSCTAVYRPSVKTEVEPGKTYSLVANQTYIASQIKVGAYKLKVTLVADPEEQSGMVPIALVSGGE